MYDKIVKDQIAICYMSSSITLEDTDYMSYYDRELILRTLQEVKEKESKQLEGNANQGYSSKY